MELISISVLAVISLVIIIFIFYIKKKEEFFIEHATFSEENDRPFFRALFYMEKIKISLYFLLIS